MQKNHYLIIIFLFTKRTFGYKITCKKLGGKMKLQNILMGICVFLLTVLLGLLVILKITLISNANKEALKQQEVSVDIMCAGDFVMHQAIIEAKNYQPEPNVFDFNDIFHYIRDVYNEGDITFATLEGALCESNYSGYPLFRTPSQLIDDLKNNGIDMLNMASNHVYDDNHPGLLHSMDVLEEKKMEYQGIRHSETAKNYVVKDISGVKVGFFDYVYETVDYYGNPGINGITMASESLPLINSYSDLDLESLYSEVQQILDAMSQEGVEYIIAFMHWGEEYQHYPNINQQTIAQKFCDMGIDALIGSHPHVVQTTDLLVNKDGSHKMVCAYSLGNHLSNQREEYMEGLSNGNTEDGLMVNLKLHKDANGEVSLQEVQWIPTWVYYEYDEALGSYYQIIPLNRYEMIAKEKNETFLVDAQESLQRTNAIINEGVVKIQQALPLK